MGFGPPEDQPTLSPWRWRVEPLWIGSLLRRFLVLLPLGVVVLYVGDHHYDAELTAAAHTFHDDLGAGPLVALLVLSALLFVEGSAAVTLGRDVAMLALAGSVAALIVPHAHMVVSPHDDNRDLRVPFVALFLVTVAHLAIDLVLLRPVFAALRARLPRSLPRATARSRERG